MNKEELLQKRSLIETQFNQKKAARDEHVSQAASLLEDMTKLQGAYQLLSELVEQNEKPTVKVKGEKK